MGTTLSSLFIIKKKKVCGSVKDIKYKQYAYMIIIIIIIIEEETFIELKLKKKEMRREEVP